MASLFLSPQVPLHSHAIRPGEALLTDRNPPCEIIRSWSIPLASWFAYGVIRMEINHSEG